MKIIFILLTVHFILGAAGFFISGRNRTAEARRDLWKKYFVYLGLALIVIAAAGTDRHLLMGLCIIIFSGSFFEIMKAAEGAGNMVTRGLIIRTEAVLLASAILFSFFVLLPQEIIILVYITVLIFDGASQVTGMLAGRRRILPVISPGKTIEGTAGGVISAVLTSAILHSYAGSTLTEAIIIGSVVCAASFTGDMLSSYLKRKLGIKDYGKLLPGQGGLLDRYDSFIFSGAAVSLLYAGRIPGLVLSEINISAYLAFSFVLLLIPAVAEIFYKSFRFRPEYLRMLIHFFTGSICLLLPTFLFSPWYIIAICLQSAVFIYLAQRLGIFRALHDVKRKTAGSPLFFIGILVAYLLSLIASDISVFYIAVLILAISDPLASAAGTYLGEKTLPGRIPLTLHSKTITGSLSFFISTIFLIAAWSILYHPAPGMSVFNMFLIAFLATASEAAGTGGTDNIYIPVVVSLCLLILG